MTLERWIEARRWDLTQAAAYFRVEPATMARWLTPEGMPAPAYLRVIYQRTGGAVRTDDFLYGDRRRRRVVT